jgi:hypothetical protein
MVFQDNAFQRKIGILPYPANEGKIVGFHFRETLLITYFL